MPVYPNMLAGLKLTADLFTTYEDHFVFKQVTTSRTNNTIDDDPELQYPLEAGAVYRVDFFIHPASNTAAGFRTVWSYPTGTSGLKECWGVDAGVSLDGDSVGESRSGVHQLNTTIEYGDRGNNAGLQHLVTEGGIISTLGAGTLALQWAQINTNATGTIVAIGSYLRIRRLS